MKIKRFLIMMGFCIGIASAGSRDSYVYHAPKVQYFIGIGTGLLSSWGGLDERPTVEANLPEEKYQEILKLPSPEMTMGYGFMLGSRVDASTVMLDAWIGSGDSQWSGGKGTSQQMLVAFEYRYSLFYPGPILPHLGIGYNFARIETDKTVFNNRNSEAEESLLIGNGAHLSLGGTWFPHRNFGLSLNYAIREIAFTGVSTPVLGMSDLDKSIWQTYSGIHLSSWFLF